MRSSSSSFLREGRQGDPARALRYFERETRVCDRLVELQPLECERLRDLRAIRENRLGAARRRAPDSRFGLDESVERLHRADDSQTLLTRLDPGDRPFFRIDDEAHC